MVSAAPSCSPSISLQTVMNLVTTLRHLRNRNGDQLQENASKLAMNSSSNYSLRSARLVCHDWKIIHFLLSFLASCSIARTFETTVSVLAQQLDDRQRYLFVTENFVFLAELVRCWHWLGKAWVRTRSLMYYTLYMRICMFACLLGTTVHCVNLKWAHSKFSPLLKCPWSSRLLISLVKDLQRARERVKGYYQKQKQIRKLKLKFVARTIFTSSSCKQHGLYIPPWRQTAH